LIGKSHIFRHLRRLATRVGEKVRLALIAAAEREGFGLA